MKSTNDKLQIESGTAAQAERLYAAILLIGRSSQFKKRSNGKTLQCENIECFVSGATDPAKWYLTVDRFIDAKLNLIISYLREWIDTSQCFMGFDLLDELLGSSKDLTLKAEGWIDCNDEHGPLVRKMTIPSSRFINKARESGAHVDASAVRRIEEDESVRSFKI